MTTANEDRIRENLNKLYEYIGDLNNMFVHAYDGWYLIEEIPNVLRTILDGSLEKINICYRLLDSISEEKKAKKI